MNLKPLFNPKSIAVIGASHDRKKLGNVIFRNCLAFGFKGKVYPINPKLKKVEGRQAFPNLISLSKAVDLVIIVTPAPTVPQILKDAVKAKAKSVVIISAGFGETGLRGKNLESQIKKIIKNKIPVIGPNCLGVVLPYLKLNASFGVGLPKNGGVSILSQSGAIAVAEMEWAASQNIGFRSIISLGNKTILNETDLLKTLGEDKGTKVILMYLEDIREGRKFLQIAQQVTKRKPVVILRAGRSQAAAKAAKSHTGALAGSSQVTDAVLKQAGCLVVNNTDEWFTLAEVFDQPKKPAGNQVAIITNAGGPGILATDAVDKAALQLSQFSKKSDSSLKKVLPPTAALHNPIDVVGDAPPERYQKALNIVLADKAVDMVLVILTHQLVTDSLKVAKIIIAAQAKTSKPILPVFIGGAKVAKGIEVMEKAGLPVFAYPEQAVFAAEALYNSKFEKRIPVLPLLKSKKIVTMSGVAISGEAAAKVLSKAKLKVLPTFKLKNSVQAINIAKRLHLPVVMKIDSPKILHKTESGGVLVDLHTPSMVKSAFKKMQNKFKTVLKNPDSNIVLQDQRFGGLELIIGAIQDPQFGPVVILGLGGIYVEAIRKVNYLCAPMDKISAQRFLENSNVWPILKGVRGQTFAVNKVAEILVKVSNFIAKHPEIKSLDLNPVLVGCDQAFILDARIEFLK
ncbi:MAG: acetate--CoA ligase family protein [Patescibacteria group bacterium]|jgi:acetyltransferase